MLYTPGLKKVLSIFLLFVFLFNISGAYLSLCFLLKEAQYEARSKISHNTLDNIILLKVSKKSANRDFHKLDDELRFGNKLYDISSIEEKGDSTYFYCIQDNDEDALLSKLDIFIEKDLHTDNLAGKSKAPQKSISDFISIGCFSFKAKADYEKDLHIHSQTVLVNIPVIDIAGPPPRS